MFIEKKHGSEVIKMSTKVMERPASDRQLAYIKRLQAETGETATGLSDEMSSSQASVIIGELIAKRQKSNGINGRINMTLNEQWKH